MENHRKSIENQLKSNGKQCKGIEKHFIGVHRFCLRSLILLAFLCLNFLAFACVCLRFATILLSCYRSSFILFVFSFW